MGIVVKVGRFSPQAVLADMVAVVGEKDDDGAICDTAFLQSREHLSDLGVHVGDVGIIAVAHFGGLLWGDGGLLGRWAQDFRALVKG
jgi:hypothetical protein